NSRNNRLHVRLLEVKTPQQQATFMQDGFTRKLNFKQHAHRETLKHLLASIDRHCVQSPKILRNTAHGMTAEGLMSGKTGRFDKQDQQPLNKGWMTGFDNKDRLAALGKELQQVEAEKLQCEKNYQSAKLKTDTTKNNLILIDRLTSLKFETIDSPSAEATLTDLKDQLKLLTDPNSTVGMARREYENIEQQLTKIQTHITDLHEQRARLETQHEVAVVNKDKAYARTDQGLTDEQKTLAEKYLPDLSNTDRDMLDQFERSERKRIEDTHDKLTKQLGTLREKLVRLMNKTQKVDTGALSEVGTEIEDIPAYLDRLAILTDESLPEKLNRFLAYLNLSSDQGVSQLLADINNEVGFIEERITELNSTLRRVEFQPDRFLQLLPTRVVHESLSSLERAQRHLRHAALTDDQGESHYRALENVTKLLRDASENKRTVGARALLDPRYRLQFAVTIVDRHTQEIIEKRTGSQGGSGGEKEIIASYILTASLSYALCPSGMTQPLFGTIVLDEAFSKSSQAVAGRIISAIREFGLHPLFVTPNKEMRLLREHTRSAILVHNKGDKTTLTSMSWEKLEDHAQRKIQEFHEVT
ncbi:MAG: SbcC/MukB-like Walker B domain-containing protein, partial [Thiohalomonadales bacterium]